MVSILFAVFRNLIFHSVELFFVIYILFSGLYKVTASTLFTAISRNKLNVVMIIESVAHGAHIHPFALIHFLPFLISANAC